MDLEAVKKFTKIYLGDDASTLESAVKVYEVCKLVQDSDRCEKAEKLRACKHAEAAKLNLNIKAV